MIRSMYTGATGMEAQQLYLDTISNNLSNVNTVGFKRSKIEFQELMYQTLREPGVRNFEGGMAPSGIEVGLGVRPAATQRIFEQGSLNQTTNPLDVAIEGDGFFQAALPDGGIVYTRDGSFKKTGEGLLVTAEGFALEPQVVVPENAMDFLIEADGRISVALPGEDQRMDIGQMELARFINPGGLKSLGGNLYAATESSGQAMINAPGEDGTGAVSQKYLEASNVQIVEEMVNMISAQRAFEIVSKSIQVSEEMLQVAGNIKR